MSDLKYTLNQETQHMVLVLSLRAHLQKSPPYQCLHKCPHAIQTGILRHSGWLNDEKKKKNSVDWFGWFHIQGCQDTALIQVFRWVDLLTSCRIFILLYVNRLTFQKHSRICSRYFSTLGGLPQSLCCNCSGILPVSGKGWWLWLYLKYAFEGNDFIDVFNCHFEIGYPVTFFKSTDL